MSRTLHWVERVLLIFGTLVAVWCGYVWLRAEYYASLPVPDPPVASAPADVLPDEAKPREYTDSGVIGSQGRSARPARSGLSERPERSGRSGRAGRAGSDHRAGRWLARLEGPSVHLRATVLEGSDGGTLARAAGHIENTALPGENGNIGIAGHRDTVFRPLRRIKVGDELKLRTSNRTYTYRVSRTSIVDPHEVHVLAPTGEPTLTLVTCYPFTFIGKAPRRFIVQAKLQKSGSRN